MGHYFTNDNNLKSEIEKVDCTIKSHSFYFYTDNGVFSKGKLDFGTELLLNSFFYDCFPEKKKVLDIGCGCGPIGIYLSKLGFNVDMADINRRAIHLAHNAIKEQQLNINVIESDCYSNINNKYDFIISNPPIKAGKKVLYDMVMGAKEKLNLNGELWIVIRKDKGALSLLRDLKEIFANTKIIEKKKGYIIIKAS